MMTMGGAMGMAEAMTATSPWRASSHHDPTKKRPSGRFFGF
jgi:hypothetical protein